MRMWSLWLDRRRQDLRVGLRGLRRSPSLALGAVAVLGLGVGMSTAMYTVYRTVLVERLPVVDAQRVVVMALESKSGIEIPTMGDELDQLRRRATTLSGVAGVYHAGSYTFPLLDGTRSVLPNRAVVTGNFFEVLGARAVVGRLLRQDDDVNGDFGRSPNAVAPEPLVLSHRAWIQWFGGDAGVVGRRLVDPYASRQFVVVGVAPAGLDYPLGTDYWLAMGRNAGADVVARLAPTISQTAAHAEFLALMRRITSDPTLEIAGATINSLPEQIFGDVRPALTVLGAAVALLMLIVCANIAGLLLLRASGRSQEIAIRRAIGASTGDVVGLLLVESVLVAVAGGAVGVVCANWLLRALLALAPGKLPRLDLVALAGTPLLAALSITVIAVLLFGVIPGLVIARGSVASPLRIGGWSAGETRSQRTVRRTLVASQIGLALVLVAAAGLLARSLARLEDMRLGYRADRLSFLAVSFPAHRYVDLDTHIFPLGDQVFARLAAVPGVVSAGPVLIPPFYGDAVWRFPFVADGASAATPGSNVWLPVEMSSGQSLATLGVPVMQGRTFSDADRDGAGLVVVVSESVARRLWPGENPIGRHLRLADQRLASGAGWRTVIGVVADLHYRDFRTSSPTVFFPWRQAMWQGWVAVRTRGPLAATLPAIERSMAEIGPEIAVSQAYSMDDLLSTPLTEPRLSAFLLFGFGLVSLALAAIGLYGMMAAAVRRRTRELGIRMALGATPTALRNGVLRDAARVIGAGAAAGAVVAILASRLVASMLFGVAPTDPVALIGAAVALTIVGLAAAYVPARRATRIDPTSVLRAE